jgi:hypothetical protein
MINDKGEGYVLEIYIMFNSAVIYVRFLKVSFYIMVVEFLDLSIMFKVVLWLSFNTNVNDKL